MAVEDILKRLGIESLTEMQKVSALSFRLGNDVVLLSPTGSGKTLAYLLPLVVFGLKAGVQGVQALVIVPSRELALQSEQVMKSMGVEWKAMSCYGGRPAMEELRAMMGREPAVIFGTPGRLNDHLSKGNIDGSKVRFLVIDEFDKCLELGFQDEMKMVVSQLTSLEQRFFLSATDAEEIPQFAGIAKPVKLNYLTELREDIHYIRLCLLQKTSWVRS